MVILLVVDRDDDKDGDDDRDGDDDKDGDDGMDGDDDEPEDDGDANEYLESGFEGDDPADGARQAFGGRSHYTFTILKPSSKV